MTVKVLVVIAALVGIAVVRGGFCGGSDLLQSSGWHSFCIRRRSLLGGCAGMGIGLSLGGTTGYAINPARDFGPRLAHALLPRVNKGESDWGYTIVPILGPSWALSLEPHWRVN